MVRWVARPAPTPRLSFLPLLETSQCTAAGLLRQGPASVRAPGLPCKFDFHASWCPHGDMGVLSHILFEVLCRRLSPSDQRGCLRERADGEQFSGGPWPHRGHAPGGARVGWRTRCAHATSRPSGTHGGASDHSPRTRWPLPESPRLDEAWQRRQRPGWGRGRRDAPSSQGQGLIFRPARLTSSFSSVTSDA